MKGTNHWANIGVRLYYIIGFFYYVYQWFIIAGGIAFLASLAGAYAFGAYFWWVFAAFVSLVLFAVGIAIWFSNWRKRYKGVNPGLKILSSHSVYKVLGDHNYEYHRELEVLASMHGVEHFTHAFRWTGDGELSVFANGNRAELTDDPKSLNKRLRVYFDRPRARGDRFKISYSLRMTDHGGDARRCLRTTIHEKVRTLTMEVSFRQEDCPATLKKGIYMSDISEIPVYEEEYSVGRGNNSISWTIRKPRFDYNYCISW